MSKENLSNVAASVRARLKNLSEQRGSDFGLVLARYGSERFLYRLASSRFQDHFVLKGATLFMAWSLDPHRPTRDIDLLGFGHNDIATVEATMREIAALPVMDDGLHFPPESVRGTLLKVGQHYEGVRITMLALLERVRISIQIDVAFGDSIVPAPEKGTFPTLLDLPAPTLQLYPRETVVAEKFHAVVELGAANTRLKDFYDFWALARIFEFEGALLCRAFTSTFGKRGTALPLDVPFGLTAAFASDSAKQLQWASFLRKSQLAPLDLVDEVLPLANSFLLPPVRAAASGEAFDHHWPAGGPWRPR
jgi:predicted nucleotidyltransferase component of viral defense system